MDRRQKMALDESYRYYRDLDKKNQSAELYKLIKCFKTVNTALNVANGSHFKLTKQLWKRMQQALFDKLITSFPGYVLVVDGQGKTIMPKATFPECGEIEFHPENCRRADDVFRMEIKHLYPYTQNKLAHVWAERGANIRPDDFEGPACSTDGCFVKPILLGQEVLDEESSHGKEEAYRQWWDLYLQAYCTKNKHEQHMIFRQMDELEQIWGNLFY